LDDLQTVIKKYMWFIESFTTSRSIKECPALKNHLLLRSLFRIITNIIRIYSK
jgi:hypothetical protein